MSTDFDIDDKQEQAFRLVSALRASVACLEYEDVAALFERVKQRIRAAEAYLDADGNGDGGHRARRGASDELDSALSDIEATTSAWAARVEAGDALSATGDPQFTESLDSAIVHLRVAAKTLVQLTDDRTGSYPERWMAASDASYQVLRALVALQETATPEVGT